METCKHEEQWRDSNGNWHCVHCEFLEIVNVVRKRRLQLIIGGKGAHA